MIKTTGRTRRHTLVALACTALMAGAHAAADAEPAWCAPRCGQIVIDWNLRTHETIVAANGYADPMAASRVLAMVHLAMHDAANAAQPRYQPHTFAAPAARTEADPAVAAASAAHGVLAGLFPGQKALVDAALGTSLLDAGTGAAMAQGRALGEAAARAVLERRAQDGSGASETYRPGERPGQYRYTPGFDFLAAPHWRSVTPFTLRSPQQFRVSAPPALGSAAYATDFNEVKAIGSAAADAGRSPEQTQIAAYWYEFSDIGWNRIARIVARQKPRDLWHTARGFALLNAVMADAYIAGWDSKMHHDFWRPVTAIGRAGEDGNAATQADPAWRPLLPTPPVQDHPSTHSALGAAAAVVLAHISGDDHTDFSMASPSARPDAPLRHFKRFSEAARENAESRIYAGVHFRFAIRAGLELGERIGQHAVRSHLKPLH